MLPLEDRINKKSTKKQIRKHLNALGKRIFRSNVVDFLNFGSSICVQNSSSSTSQSTKVLSAIEKADDLNKEAQDYIEWIINGINRLEKVHRKVILGKYLYKYDDEEFEEATGCSMRKVADLLSDAELDLAIILNCVVYKSEKKPQD